MEELQSVVKILREDLANERNQSTEQELLIHDQQNKIDDLKRHSSNQSKREELLRQNLQEVNIELERLRENETNTSYMSQNSFHQAVLQELELKVSQL